MESPFEIRGVIEGFYGIYYTFPERNDLIRFIAENGYNMYLYAPKDDRQHRDKWREPYPEDVMAQFAGTVEVAREVDVRFCYTIAPGLSINYVSDEDLQSITTKFKAFYDIGVRDFGMLLDDIPRDFAFENDRETFDSYAEAHASICNKVYSWLQQLDAACTLNMCPTDYWGTPPFSKYISELGERLHGDIDMFYTGPDICTAKIPLEDTEAFSDAVGRFPLIWENYPVNDLTMAPEMHIGPIEGRDQNLYETVRGFAVNVMNQPEASKIPLLTFADYFSDPHNYDPISSWDKALEQIAGTKSYPSIRTFAENSLRSCLQVKEAEKLEALTGQAIRALRQQKTVKDNKQVRELLEYIKELDDACYHLKYRMDNLALRYDLLPWTELLERWCKLARISIEVFEASIQGIPDEKSLSSLLRLKEEINAHPKHIGDHVLFSLADEVIAQVQEQYPNML